MIFLRLLLSAWTLAAQPPSTPANETPEFIDHFYTHVRDYIRIPDIPGYQTLKCDLHIHTVYSDGIGWSSQRVDEAWSEGLDAIAMTEHVEYRPYVKEGLVSGDQNQSYRIAKAQGDRMGILVIPGAEISRYKPLGHLNALFISDATPLETDDALTAIDAAIAQGAFIQWNHPGWPDNKSTFYEVHESQIRDKKIHGVEVINYLWHYLVALDWCQRYGLAYIGNSDIHGTITESFVHTPGMRPLTLAFTRERNLEGIKEALFAGRSALRFNNLPFGPPEYLQALIRASLKFDPVYTDSKGNRTFNVDNRSDIEFRLRMSERMIVVPRERSPEWSCHPRTPRPK